jgi:hypothetical protein
VPKNSQNTPVPMGHWDGAIESTYNIPPNVGTVFLESVPTAHGNMDLVLPAHPSDGDWYEWSDLLGLVSDNYPLVLSSSDGKKVNNETSISITTAQTSGKAVYNATIDQWGVVGPVP